MRRVCCGTTLGKLSLIIHPIFGACLSLADSRQKFRQGGTLDLFYMRVQYSGRTASQDLDLLYGLLGVARSPYEIVPDYSRSVEDAYTEVSRKFLESYTQAASFWIFVYVPLKNRYVNMPSWVVDWTRLDSIDCFIDSRRWATLHKRFQSKRTTRLISRWGDNVSFKNGMMILYAQQPDTIAVVGEVMDFTNTPGRDEDFHKILDSWRNLVMVSHVPGDAYQTLLPSRNMGLGRTPGKERG